MLPADRYKLVEPANSDACKWCSQRHMPGVEHIAVNNNPSGIGEDDAPGTLETADTRQAGRTAYRVRTASGQTETIPVADDQFCSDCVKRMAKLVRWGDTVPLYDRINELEAKLLNECEAHRRTTKERDEAERVANDLSVRLRAAERKLPKPSKPKTSKRSQPAAA